jgi:hypothetical protein
MSERTIAIHGLNNFATGLSCFRRALQLRRCFLIDPLCNSCGWWVKQV